MLRDVLLHEQARGLVDSFIRTKSATKSSISHIGGGNSMVDLFFSPIVDISLLSETPKRDLDNTSNVVVQSDIDRILRGKELRTTLMLKKVPRKYEWRFSSCT